MILKIFVWGLVIWTFSVLVFFILFIEDYFRTPTQKFPKNFVLILLYSFLVSLVVVLFTFSQCSDNIKTIFSVIEKWGVIFSMNDFLDKNLDLIKDFFGITFRALLEVIFISVLLYKKGLKESYRELRR
jgi:hypothetical protein